MSAEPSLARVSPSIAADPSPHRVAAIDLLRGLVIVLMALDHVRDYFSAARFDPTDLARTTPVLFLVRWVTHPCAPVFVLLAGTAAWLHGRRLTRRALARFLVARGAWLVLLETTVIAFAWTFNLRFEFGIVLQVVWALGASMMVLGGLVLLPRWAIAAFALITIAGHNLLDGLQLAPGAGKELFEALHVPGRVEGTPFYVAYPLGPWSGVMAAGYVLAPLLSQAWTRRRDVLALGAALTAAFVVVRALNVYGDPAPWTAHPERWKTVLSFLATTKYPPSLAYLLMTLGPAMLLLVGLRGLPARASRVLAAFGGVPLFFYVVHLYVIHALSVAAGSLQGFPAASTMRIFFAYPSGFGFSLPVVLGVWLLVVALLYPACVRYGELKRRGRAWWWSYL
jgi:uncharacterized membrane protein